MKIKYAIGLLKQLSENGSIAIPTLGMNEHIKIKLKRKEIIITDESKAKYEVDSDNWNLVFERYTELGELNHDPKQYDIAHWLNYKGDAKESAYIAAIIRGLEDVINQYFGCR